MRQRQFRTKPSFAEDDDEPAPAVVKPAKSDKKKEKGKVASLLSFGDDDDVNVPTPDKKKDKDKSKSKFRAKLPASSSLGGASTTQISSAGEYTAEKLKQLEGNALHFSSSSINGPLAPSQPVIKLSGSFKLAGAPKDDRFAPSSTPVRAKPKHPESSSMPPPPARCPTPSGAGEKKKAAITVMPSDEEEDDGPALPTDEMIRVAKAKRERLRQAHLAPDYIPLGGAAKLTSTDFKPAEEATNSGSDDELEDNMRMKFMGAVSGRARMDRRQFSRSTGETEDEEEFAAAQLKKAIRHNAGQDTAGEQGAGASKKGAAQGQVSGLAAFTAARLGNRTDAIYTAGEVAINNMQEALEQLKASHRQACRNRDRTTVNLNTALANMDSVQAELKAAGEKYVGLQEVRDWVADLCSCLQHKSVIIEELEEHLLSVMEDRVISSKELESAVSKELVEVAEAGVSAAIQVVSRGGALAAAAAAAQSALTEAEQRVLSQGGAGAAEVDEFGRSLNYGREREAEERAQLRKAQLERAAEAMKAVSSGKPLALDTGGAINMEDGSQVKRYESRRAEVISAATTSFADAAEPFSTLRNVKFFLEHRFKYRYPKEYASAYMSLSVPALLAPYVRLELLQWDPMFEPRYRSFEQQQWYDELFNYGIGSGANTVEGDADLELVPMLVKKVVLPRALHFVARCWNPRRWQQSLAVSELLQELLQVYVPPDDERMHELVNLVKGTLTDAVTAAQIPPWPTSATAACTPALQVLHIKFCDAVTLLRTISAFEGLLARNFLFGLAFDQMVWRHMLTYLKSGTGDVCAAIARCEAVVESLSEKWFRDGVPKEAVPLTEHVQQLGQSLEVQTSQAVLKHKQGLLKRLAHIRTRLGMSQGS